MTLYVRNCNKTCQREQMNKFLHKFGPQFAIEEDERAQLFNLVPILVSIFKFSQN